MIYKLPNFSTNSSDPLWIPERPPSLLTNHRSSYRGHYHKTKIAGPDCLRAESKKPKVSAYLSTLPLSPPDDFAYGEPGKHWLADSFKSKEVKWRRGNSLQLSQEPFDVTSRYQTDFPPKPCDERISYVPKHIPLKSMEKFNSISTYNNDFLFDQYEKDDICFKLKKPQNQDILTWKSSNRFQNLFEHKRNHLPPLDESTTYRTQFQFKPTSIPKFFKNTETQSPKSYLPFDCKSSYQSDFNESVFKNRDHDEFRISSCGFLNKDINNQELYLSPYIEYQRPVFYTVNN